MTVITLIVLGAILSYGVFHDGGAHRPEWHQCLLAFGLWGVVYTSLRALRALRGELVQWPPKRTLCLLALTVAVCIFQLLPLSPILLKYISPGTLEVVSPVFTAAGTGRPEPISLEPSATFQGALNLLACILIFTVVGDCMARWKGQIWTPAMPLIVIGLLEAILGILQTAYGNAKNSVSGTYANRNHFAGLLEMCLPFAVMLPLAIWRRASHQRDALMPVLFCCGWMAVSAVFLVAVVDSLSRMGFIATLLSLFLIAVSALPHDFAEKYTARWISIAVLAILGVLFFFLLPSAAFIARFGGSLTLSELSADTRRQIWSDTLSLLRNFPVFGCGYGAYQSAFMRYQTAAPLTTVNFVHNDYLQLMAELGAVGFIPLALVAVGAWQTVIRRVHSAGNEEERCFYIACLGSFAAISIHSFVDFNLYMPANATVLAWIAAMACAPEALVLKTASKSRLRKP